MKNINFSKIFEIIKAFFSKDRLFSSQLISEHLKLFIIIVGGIFFLAILLKILTIWKFKEQLIYQKLFNMIFTWLVTTVLVLSFLIFCNWQAIGFFSYIFWWYLWGLTFLIWGIIICNYRFKKFLIEVEEFEDLKRKEKYLPKPKRKK